MPPSTEPIYNNQPPPPAVAGHQTGRRGGPLLPHEVFGLTDDEIRSIVDPAGVIKMFAGSEAPDGWLLCNGSAIVRSLYPELYATIGTTYGTGDGLTTFNLPNLSGRVPVGVSSTDSDFNLADTGGAKTHFHWQTFGADPTIGFGEVDGAGSGHTSVITVDRVTFTVGSRATDGSRRDGTYDESSLQPYLTVNFIIKY